MLAAMSSTIINEYDHSYHFQGTRPGFIHQLGKTFGRDTDHLAQVADSHDNGQFQSLPYLQRKPKRAIKYDKVTTKELHNDNI